MSVCIHQNIQSITCIMRATVVTWNTKLVTRITWIKLHRIGGSSITRHSTGAQSSSFCYRMRDWHCQVRQ